MRNLSIEEDGLLSNNDESQDKKKTEKCDVIFLGGTVKGNGMDRDGSLAININQGRISCQDVVKTMRKQHTTSSLSTLTGAPSE